MRKFKNILFWSSLTFLFAVISLSILIVNRNFQTTGFIKPGDLIYDPGETTGYYNNNQIQVPAIAYLNDSSYVLGVWDSPDKWIEVDLSEQKVKAWQGSDLYLESLVSTGLPWYPTPKGEFRIWAKVRSTKMEGGSGRYYYYLPNVPFTMFFENDNVPGWKGYGLHGTYWHNNFGTQRSHGCVNLPTSVAEKLYYWTTPSMPEGKSFIKSAADNPGTRIVIHE